MMTFVTPRTFIFVCLYHRSSNIVSVYSHVGFAHRFGVIFYTYSRKTLSVLLSRVSPSDFFPSSREMVWRGGAEVHDRNNCLTIRHPQRSFSLLFQRRSRYLYEIFTGLLLAPFFCHRLDHFHLTLHYRLYVKGVGIVERTCLLTLYV